MQLTFQIAGIGPVPSFKNTKQIVHNRRTGVPLLITDPKKKRWMDLAKDQLEYQLRGAFPIIEGETVGEWQKRLQIVWWQLLDDSLKQMLPGDQNVEFVKKGDEGCVIIINTKVSASGGENQKP